MPISQHLCFPQSQLTLSNRDKEMWVVPRLARKRGMGKCQGDCGIPQPSLQSEDMPQKPLDVSTPLFYPRAEEQQASLPGEQPRDANAARIHKSVRVCSHMVHQKAPCCKAGRFSYVDLYWENRHLVSGLPFLVYTSEYSISGLRMCLQNGGSAVS